MNVTWNFEDRVAIVTGGASGMGKATVEAFAAAGAKVVIVDVDIEGGEALAASVAASGGEARFVRTDVSDEAQVEAMVATTLDLYGGLDFAANYAGVEQPTVKTSEMSVELWDRIIGIHLTGAFLCSKHQAPAMVKRGGGSIINVSSGGLRRTNAGTAAYSAAKLAVEQVTRVVAADFGADGVRVNTLRPGAIDTPMLQQALKDPNLHFAELIKDTIPLGRMGRTEEIAGVALWLCSDAASYVTAQTIAVDGGYL